jgi:hypothetical protein
VDDRPRNRLSGEGIGKGSSAEVSIQPPECARERANDALVVRIKAQHAASRETDGSPRIHAALKKEGVRWSQNRVARIMRTKGIKSVHRKRFKGTCPAPARDRNSLIL